MAPGNTPSIDEQLSQIAEKVDAMTAQLAEFRSLLDQYRPLLDAWRGTGGGTIGVMRAMRGKRGSGG